MSAKTYATIVSEYLDLFLQYNEQQFRNNSPKELYDPIRYIMSIGGKRFRPICVLMAHHLFDSDWATSVAPAYAIELFHNFTLLHDDIMDEADTRRGHATVHAKFDTNSAILAGDNMLIFCYKYIYGSIQDPLLAAQAIKILTENAIKVCEGQAMDVEFESRLDVTESEYIQMIQYKTAALIGAAFELGAALGGAPPSDVSALFDFGLNTGIAFQILDDLLDTYGDSSFGKKIGGDIIQGKKTLLYLMCRDAANGEDRIKLESTYTNEAIADDQKLEIVKGLFQKYEVESRCKVYINKYHDQALHSISQLNVDTKTLRDLTEVMIIRNV